MRCWEGRKAEWKDLSKWMSVLIASSHYHGIQSLRVLWAHFCCCWRHNELCISCSEKICSPAPELLHNSKCVHGYTITLHIPHISLQWVIPNNARFANIFLFSSAGFVVLGEVFFQLFSHAKQKNYVVLVLPSSWIFVSLLSLIWESFECSLASLRSAPLITKLLIFFPLKYTDSLSIHVHKAAALTLNSHLKTRR